jgi:hypothetical protein
MLSPVRDHGKRCGADIGRAVRHYASAIAFLVTLVVIVGASGCGQRVAAGADDAPAASDLAADALAALEREGSAHFVGDVKSGVYGSELGVGLHAEGDASTDALDASGSLTFGSATFRGRVLVDDHQFFLQFMDSWYGENQGIADALRRAKSKDAGHVWDEVATPAGIRRNFDQLFDGNVKAGPDVDGTTTWEFDGQFSADGLAAFGKRFDAGLTDRDEALFKALAESSRFVLVVGREDKLPRRLEFSVHLTPDQLKQMQESSSPAFQGAENFEMTLELSDFGEQVEIHPPADFAPLDTLFEQLFSGLE